MDLPLLLKIELREITNGVLLTIGGDGQPTRFDPLGERGRITVGPLHYPSVDDALDVVARLARDGLKAQESRRVEAEERRRAPKSR